MQEHAASGGCVTTLDRSADFAFRLTESSLGYVLATKPQCTYCGATTTVQKVKLLSRFGKATDSTRITYHNQCESHGQQDRRTDPASGQPDRGTLLYIGDPSGDAAALLA